jgi:transcriptional regulator with XRE-family HTH domain
LRDEDGGKPRQNHHVEQILHGVETFRALPRGAFSFAWRKYYAVILTFSLRGGASRPNSGAARFKNFALCADIREQGGAMQERAKAVAERLRVLILERGWNQSELARRSGMRPSNVSNYLRGTNVPNPRQLAKLAEALGTTPGDILSASAEASTAPRSLRLTHVEERSGQLRLQVDQVVTAEVATQVIGLLMHRMSNVSDRAPLAEDGNPANESELLPRMRACGGNILDALLPANPPTPINAKQIRPLDGPAPVDVFEKPRKVG